MTKRLECLRQTQWASSTSCCSLHLPLTHSGQTSGVTGVHRSQTARLQCSGDRCCRWPGHSSSRWYWAQGVQWGGHSSRPPPPPLPPPRHWAANWTPPATLQQQSRGESTHTSQNDGATPIMLCWLWRPLWTKGTVSLSTRVSLGKPLISLQQGLTVFPARPWFWCPRGPLPPAIRPGRPEAWCWCGLPAGTRRSSEEKLLLLLLELRLPDNYIEIAHLLTDGPRKGRIEASVLNWECCIKWPFHVALWTLCSQMRHLTISWATRDHTWSIKITLTHIHLQPL